MPSPMPILDSCHTALVLIDLQNGIVGMNLQPRTGPEAVSAARALAERFRAAGAPVVLVRVDLGPGAALAPPGLVDQPLQLPPGGPAPDWSTLVDGLRHERDVVVTKRHWGAFTGTELDTVLRRLKVDTIVLGGIATNFGVESTARHAWEHGYHVVVAEDACTSVSAALHESSIRHVLPRIARVTRAAEIDLTRG